MASVRCSTGSQPSKTVAMPPSPSTPRISKRPMVAGGVSMPGAHGAQRTSCRERLRLVRLYRQKHRKGRALSDFRAHVDASAVLLHDLVGDGKPKPGALPHFLGGEERVENLRENAFRN